MREEQLDGGVRDAGWGKDDEGRGQGCTYRGRWRRMNLASTVEMKCHSPRRWVKFGTGFAGVGACGVPPSRLSVSRGP